LSKYDIIALSLITDQTNIVYYLKLMLHCNLYYRKLLQAGYFIC